MISPEYRDELSVYPKCEHLLDNPFSDKPSKTCSWVSERVGRVYPTSQAWCNLVCHKVGPYCGQKEAESQEFLKRSLLRHTQIMNKAFYEKIVAKYQTPTDISIPSTYESIKQALSSLWKMDGFKGILLTGSCIISNAPWPPKDYDIVLQFDTLANVIKGVDAIKALPKEIGGIKTDYFYYLGENPDLYFVSLDCDNKILYTSQWFELKLNKLQEGITVIHKTPPLLTNVIESFFNEKEIEELKARGVGLLPKKSRCCGK